MSYDMIWYVMRCDVTRCGVTRCGVLQCGVMLNNYVILLIECDTHYENILNMRWSSMVMWCDVFTWWLDGMLVCDVDPQQLCGMIVCDVNPQWLYDVLEKPKCCIVSYSSCFYFLGLISLFALMDLERKYSWYINYRV